VSAGAGRPLRARRRELDARGNERAQLAVARIEPQPDALAGDLEILDPPVRCERLAQLVESDARNDEVLVLRVTPQQLVPDCTPDEVRVEVE
jgi:hypothetical protein